MSVVLTRKNRVNEYSLIFRLGVYLVICETSEVTHDDGAMQATRIVYFIALKWFVKLNPRDEWIVPIRKRMPHGYKSIVSFGNDEKKGHEPNSLYVYVHLVPLGVPATKKTEWGTKWFSSIHCNGKTLDTGASEDEGTAGWVKNTICKASRSGIVHPRKCPVLCHLRYFLVLTFFLITLANT
ncbi:hypothetical protein PsorP6_015393 [Peronosclerospora sorghi]|uniref:Uncharacterized protein n=1 Tax=Peronosclerospora sorghi TaxID=230839 RepID=A0ACC0WR86_9STRA|nr:hypothetical protein PsorP6_015393 [Peronosclerospora sorghi]